MFELVSSEARANLTRPTLSPSVRRLQGSNKSHISLLIVFVGLVLWGSLWPQKTQVRTYLLSNRRFRDTEWNLILFIVNLADRPKISTTFDAIISVSCKTHVEQCPKLSPDYHHDQYNQYDVLDVFPSCNWASLQNELQDRCSVQSCIDTWM